MKYKVNAKYSKKYIKKLVVLFIFIFFIWNILFGGFLNGFKKLNNPLLLLSFIPILFSYIYWSWIYYKLFESTKSFKKVFYAFLGSVFIDNTTPTYIASSIPAFIYLMNKLFRRSIKMVEITTKTLFLGLSWLYTFLILSFLGLIISFFYYKFFMFSLIGFILFAFLIILKFLFLRKESLILKLAKKIRLKDHYIHKLKDIHNQIQFFSLRDYLFIAFKFIFIYIMQFLGLYMLFIVFNININPFSLFVVFILSIIISLISFMPGGIGSFEISFYLLISSYFSLPSNILSAIIVLFRLFNYWIPTLLGGIIFFKSLK